MTQRLQIPATTPAQDHFKRLIERSRALREERTAPPATTVSPSPGFEIDQEASIALNQDATRVQDILARPGARSPQGILNPRVVSTEEARLVADFERKQPQELTRFQQGPVRTPVETALKAVTSGLEATAEAGLAVTQSALDIGPRAPVRLPVGPSAESIERSRESLRDIGGTLTGQRTVGETVRSLSERQQERPLGEQLTAGAVFDPLNVLPGVGQGADIARVGRALLKETREQLGAQVVKVAPEAGLRVAGRPGVAGATDVGIPPAATEALAGDVGRTQAPTVPTSAVETPVTSPAIPTAPSTARLRLSIRNTKQQGGGFLIVGRDTKNRQVRVFAKTLQEAKQAKENIRQGLEAFPGTEAEAQARDITKAERKLRASLKKGEPGAIERARLDLEQAQARTPPPGGVQPPIDPPTIPPSVSPAGGMVPTPDFESTRNKLVGLLRTSVRKGQKELQAGRSTELARKAAIARRSTERALAEGRSPLPGIRAAQRGEFAEVTLSEAMTTQEVAVLRDRIYTTLGPELDFTAANIEEALTRLATEGKLPTESEMAWMEEIFGPELVEALRGLRSRGAKIREGLIEAWNLPRTILASFDDSMVLRQGVHLLPEGAPAGRALKAHIKALKQSGADEVNAVIRANSWFNHGRAHGLDLTLPGLGRGIGGREEAFFGAGALRHIPVLRSTLGKGIEISERVATAYLNKLRIETYAAHAAELTRMGASFDSFKELAQNINILSGRATLGRAQAVAPILNGMFFSARLNWARMQMPFRILRQVPNLGTEEGRHLARMLARDVYGVWAGIGGMVGLAAASGVAAVELDSRSSDFGKMQIGTVRVDPWAGQQQFAVLMARLASGERVTTITGQVVPAGAVDTLARFIESKFHPALGQLIALKEGKTFIGEDLTPSAYAKQWIPLFAQDIQEIATGTSPGVATGLGLAAFFGVSVYNIPGVPATVLNQLQAAVDEYNKIPTDPLELGVGDVTRTGFRQRNPDADAALFLAGQVSSLETLLAVQAVVDIVRENGINPEILRGVAERQERQQKARDVGRLLEPTLIDILIHALGAPTLQGGSSTQQGAPRRAESAPRRDDIAPGDFMQRHRDAQAEGAPGREPAAVR